MVTAVKPPPRLSAARQPLTRGIEVFNQDGQRQSLLIPAERPLTVYVDKRELVTLMTLGERPEWLTLGYLMNQRLIDSAADVAAIDVDWEVNAAAVITRQGIPNLEARTAHRVVTTGCGQGSLFGEVLSHLEGLTLPATTVSSSQIAAIVQTIRLQDSTYKAAGSVHGVGLFRGAEPLLFVEDVGRHNALDTIAGWMALQALDELPLALAGLVLYTTGRLTSEMVMKAAQMGVAVVISRSGMTEMGHALATQLGLCAIGRALNQRFLCFSAPERLNWETLPQRDERSALPA